jgi:hypothetical protein
VTELKAPTFPNQFRCFRINEFGHPRSEGSNSFRLCFLSLNLHHLRSNLLHALKLLFVPKGIFAAYSLALVSGRLQGRPCCRTHIIKEANPPDVSGTATGVVNFLNFTSSALLGRVFGRLHRQLAPEAPKMELANYQTAFAPLILGVTVAIVLTMFLKETGSAVRR